MRGVDGASVLATATSSFERVLVATGRRPNVDGLEALGLTVTPRGIVVDERLRAAENVWAIGDVTGIAQFTHVGKYHARIVAYDITGRTARADHRAIPATIFTDPQVATVGDARRPRRPLGADLHAAPLDLRAPEARGFVKVAADPNGGSSPARSPSARRPASGCSS